MSEKVLVVQNNLLGPHIKNGSACLITDHTQTLFNAILENHSYMPRHLAEYNFEHKQVIPYVIIRNHDNYLLLKRTTKQTEKRLHNKYSLGIGGHVNPDRSMPEENIIVSGLYKELNEEISLDTPAELTFIGIINDESSSVSRVHLGMLYVLDAASPEYEVLETHKMTAEWTAKDKLAEYYHDMETWSQIVCDYYIIKRNSRSRGRNRPIE